jgi:oligopeptide/dipeptide ABC transporter ATP-binding protein
MLDSNGQIVNGEIRFDDRDLAQLSEQELKRTIRWQEISYIPQSAMAALDPVYRVGDQIVEVIRAHTDTPKAEAWKRAKGLLTDVGLDENRVNDYPHELSGGQRQRVTIALSLALTPSLIIADEPTTGLDVLVQDDILKLLLEIQDDINCSMIFVTHDMSVITEVANDVVVMYGGKVMEKGTTRQIFVESTHPYTIGLRNAFPSISKRATETQLISIPGSPPNLRYVDDGCRFRERCPFATEECKNDPPMQTVSPGHDAKCHYTDDAAGFREQGKKAETWRETRTDMKQ